MEILEEALKYQKKGFSVIPVKSNSSKKPFFDWEQYQTEKPTEKEINKWWKKWPNAGIAIITGAISGIDVIDVDSLKGEDLLIEELGDDIVDFILPTARTPRGGKHLYFKSTGEGCKVGFLENVDFRGQGGYIIAPPSRGPNGKSYSWIKGGRNPVG